MKYEFFNYGTITTPSSLVKLLRDYEPSISNLLCKICVYEDQTCCLDDWLDSLADCLKRIYWCAIPTGAGSYTKIPVEIYSSILFKKFKTKEDTKRTLVNYNYERLEKSLFEVDDDLVDYTYESIEWLSKVVKDAMWADEFPDMKRKLWEIFDNNDDQGII